VDYGASDARLRQVNALATAQLVKACELKGVQRFVFVSSTSVYRGLRLASGSVVSERTPAVPGNAYGKSKLAAEHALQRSRLDYVVLRPPIVYGPGFEDGFSLVAKLLRKRRMPFIGRADNAISFIHVDDLVQAIGLALSGKARRQTFLVTSGETLSQEQLLTEFAHALRVPAPRRHVSLRVLSALFSALALKDRILGRKPRFFKEYLYTLAVDRRYDISKARRLLGFSPRVSFRKALPAFARSLKTS